MKVRKSPVCVLRVLTLSIISPVTGLSEADYFSQRVSDCLSKYHLLIFEPFEFFSTELKHDLRFVWKAQRPSVHAAVRRGQKQRRQQLPALHRHIPVAAGGHRGWWAQAHSHTPHPKTACLPALKTWACVFCPAEPLSGVIEGVSAGMFLVVMMVGVTALLVCRQKARKVWVWTRLCDVPTKNVLFCCSNVAIKS